MDTFISHELEIEHGDLGLGTNTDIGLPPLSTFGRALKRNGKVITVRELVTRVRGQSGGNVTMALLRLESIRHAESVEDVAAIADRLPANMVENFNTGIAKIGGSSRGSKEIPDYERRRRLLGLTAIQLVGRSPDGIPLDRLKAELIERMRDWESRFGVSAGDEVTLEEILGAARGFLITNKTGRIVKCFHADFYLFAAEDYNEILARLENTIALTLR